MTEILEITDGVTTIDMLTFAGFRLQSWLQGTPNLKGGGVWSSSPLVAGRKLAFGRRQVVTERLVYAGNWTSADNMATAYQHEDYSETA